MNTEQKTPEQWFQQLKEPYRSEAISGIDKSVKGFQDYPESLADALFYCIYWGTTKDKKPTRNDWKLIYTSVDNGETTYLETELKPQDMTSGEWYVIDVDNLGYCIVKFKTITNEHIIMFINGLHIHTKSMLLNTKGLCFINDIKSIRKATREEVLEHFPDEFKGEKKTATNSIYQPLFDLMSKEHDIDLLPSEMEEIINVCEKILESRKEEKKEVESELKDCEMYFYFDGLCWCIDSDLEKCTKLAESDSIIYRATPIGKKQTKSFLEPIKK